MNPIKQFELERQANIKQLGTDQPLRAISLEWLRQTLPYKYSYNFTSLGRPIIQYPQDMIAIQEIIWKTKPDLIIETGIAHGGSLIMSASILALIDYCEAAENRKTLDPEASNRRVLGLDIDIRPHNRQAIESHPLSHRIDMIQGSSIDPDIVSQVHSIAAHFQSIMIILDSNHTHSHVLNELEAYAPLTSKGNYCVVFDTVIEDLPNSTYPDRPWKKGDNPKTAVGEFLHRLNHDNTLAADGQPLKFEIDSEMENKLLITVAPNGYLKRT